MRSCSDPIRERNWEGRKGAQGPSKRRSGTVRAFPEVDGDGAERKFDEIEGLRDALCWTWRVVRRFFCGKRVSMNWSLGKEHAKPDSDKSHRGLILTLIHACLSTLGGYVLCLRWLGLAFYASTFSGRLGFRMNVGLMTRLSTLGQCKVTAGS